MNKLKKQLFKLVLGPKNMRRCFPTEIELCVYELEKGFVYKEKYYLTLESLIKKVKEDIEEDIRNIYAK